MTAPPMALGIWTFDPQLVALFGGILGGLALMEEMHHWDEL